MNEELKKLRQLTKAGLMDCKKALEVSENFDEAIKYLQKRGMAKVEKRLGNETKEGAVVVSHDEDNCVMMLWKVETDFVAQNEDFCSFINNESMLFLKAEDKASFIVSDEFQIRIKNISAKIGENVVCDKHCSFSLKDCAYNIYFHGILNEKFDNIAKVGVVLLVQKGDPTILKNISANIAAYKLLELNVTENISKENALSEQTYLFDSSLKIKDFLIKEDIKILNYYLFFVEN